MQVYIFSKKPSIAPPLGDFFEAAGSLNHLAHYAFFLLAQYDALESKHYLSVFVETG